MKRYAGCVCQGISHVTHGLGELIFPPACAGCGVTLTANDGGWCLGCTAKLQAAITKPACPRCGTAVGEFLFDENGCPGCRHTRIRPDGFVRVGTYHDLVGQTLRRFKFQHDHRLDAPLGDYLAAAIQHHTWHVDLQAIVPVPTDWRGRWRYRAWPAAMLARRVAAGLHVPVVPAVYVKGKKRRQVGLPQSARPQNVRGVFHVSRHARLDGACICVVDDVSTTGSTIHEMVRVLREAGAARVYAAVLARTDPQRHDGDSI